ncbi:MAG: alpha/beta fold hydrolase [Pyrinomonadaceae bacterium]
MKIERLAEVNTIDLSEVAHILHIKPFRPNLLFRGHHAQTLAGYAYPRRFGLRRYLDGDEKRLFEVEPNVKLLAHCRWQPKERQSNPTLILVHGLEGSSDSVYLLGTAAKAFKAGFNVLRLNLRTCGGTEHLTSTLYHSGLSQDLRAVISELICTDGLENIFLGGFSLGGNMSLKLAGELGDSAPPQLRGICAVSPSIDLSLCATAIEQPSNWLYNRRFVSSLKKRIRRIQRINPERYDLADIKTVRTIREFDACVTARYGGFRDVEDYYTRSSSLRLIKDIRIPTLIIHAHDDPFVPFDSFRHPSLAANPFVILLAPKQGGHVGFIAADTTAGNKEDRFWAENRLVEFCQLLSVKKRLAVNS